MRTLRIDVPCSAPHVEKRHDPRSRRHEIASNPIIESEIPDCISKMRSPDIGDETWAAHFSGNVEGELLVVAYDQLRGDGFEIAEESTSAVVGAGGEIEL